MYFWVWSNVFLSHVKCISKSGQMYFWVWWWWLLVEDESWRRGRWVRISVNFHQLDTVKGGRGVQMIFIVFSTNFFSIIVWLSFPIDIWDIKQFLSDPGVILVYFLGKALLNEMNRCCWRRWFFNIWCWSYCYCWFWWWCWWFGWEVAWLYKMCCDDREVPWLNPICPGLFKHI